MRKRKSSRTLTGSRIYIRDGSYKHFSPEPILNPRTGKVAKWHKLCAVAEGELQARIYLKELRGFVDQPKGAGDFCIWFCEWRKEITREREQATPRDPVRKAIWVKGTKSLLNVMGVIENAFADFDLIQVAPSDVALFVDQWKRRRASQTYKGLLTKFFSWCCRRGIMRENPAREVTIDPPRKRVVYMTDEVYISIKRSLLDATGGRQTTHNEVMVSCLMDLYYLLYQRSTDVRLLRNTGLDGNEIKFTPTKTENSSAVEVRVLITDDIRDVVERARSVAKLRSIYLIHDEHGQPFNSRQVRDIFKQACERVNIHGYILKDVRSKAASDAKKAGYSEEQIKIALAHTTTDTTRDYIRGQEAPLSEVVMKLPKG